MMVRNASSFVLLATLATATAAACSASNSRSSSQGTTGFGASTGTGAASTSSGSQGGAGNASGSGGGVSFTVGSGGSTSTAGTGGSGQPAFCTACVAAGGKCVGGTCTINDNPGNVAMGSQTMLQAGGTSDMKFAWLYPYDKTVFPRNLTSPTLQFGGTTPTSFYVHIAFPGMDYSGFYTANGVKGFQIGAADWTAITDAAGPTSAVKVEVTKLDATGVTGPITETWTVAQGSLKGTIYYETYGSALIQATPNGGGSAGGGVGIMKIQPGAAAPTIVKQQCGNVCHTASADGSTLVANAGSEFGGNQAEYYASASYDLKNNANTIFATDLNAFPTSANQMLTYGGIYPDGSFVVSATGYRTYESGTPALYYTGSQAGTQGGARITAPGFDGAVQATGTPAFSPDGKMLALNTAGNTQVGGGGTLTVMSFNKATFTFSASRSVATHANGSTVAWPAFTPDGKWVVYHVGSNAQYETDNGATADLYVAPSAGGGTPQRLDALDGYNAAGTYLPASDPNLSFAPTLLPEAVGGYFWVVFTSHRSYGNTLASKATLQDGLNGSPSPDALGKLWVAAVDINAQPGVDPSHPAFYLDGQELEADNLRGFWVLNPCQQNGTTCVTGDDCCGGFCRPGDAGTLQCTTTGGGCSNLYENCTTASDCCLSGAECINGKCAQPPPQ
jgi:hypothetical protein